LRNGLEDCRSRKLRCKPVGVKESGKSSSGATSQDNVTRLLEIVLVEVVEYCLQNLLSSEVESSFVDNNIASFVARERSAIAIDQISDVATPEVRIHFGITAD